MTIQYLKVSLLAGALALGSAGVAAAAQNDAVGGADTATTNPAYTTTTQRNDNRGFDPGWLGLIGLAGLAGLMKKNRSVATTTNTRGEYAAPNTTKL